MIRLAQRGVSWLTTLILVFSLAFSIVLIKASSVNAIKTANSALLNGAPSVTVLPGATISASVNVTTYSDPAIGGPNWFSTRWSINSTLPTPASMSCDPAPEPNITVGSTNSRNFNITAPLTEGVYNTYFIAYGSAGCTGGTSNTLTLNSSVIVDNTAPSIPTHVSPANDSYRTTASQTLIDWTDANDVSPPVSYYYQSSNSPATNPDGSFVSLAYTSGALAASAIPTPGTSAGIYYWHVRAVDSLGNSSAWSSAWKVTVDNTIPTVSISAPGNGSFQSGNVQIDGNGADNFSLANLNVTVTDSSMVEVSNTDYGISGTNTPFTEFWDSTSQPNGDYTITAITTDSAGNVSSSASVTITVDNTAPFLTTQRPTENSYVRDTISVRARTSDNDTGIDDITFEVLGGGTGQISMLPLFSDPERYRHSFNTNSVGDGAYTFRFISTNNAGVQTTKDVLNVTIDNTNPTAALASPVDGVYYVSGNDVPIDGSFTDTNIKDYKVLVATDAAGTTCQSNVGGNVVFSTGWLASGNEPDTTTLANFDSTTVADGKYYAVLCARDLAGNRTRVHNGPSGFNVDNTLPTVDAGADKTKNALFTQTGSSTDLGGSGIASRTWSKISGPGTVTFGSASADETTVSADADSTYVIQLSATDNAGNTNTATFTLVWDTTKPVLALPANITGVTPVGPTGATVAYSASASDIVDGAIGISCSPASGATFAIGTTTVNCSATDAAGNTANGSFSVTVDPEPVAPAAAPQGAGGGGDQGQGGAGGDANVLAENTDNGNANNNGEVKALEGQRGTDKNQNDSNSNWWWWILILIALGIAGYFGWKKYKDGQEEA